MRITIQLYKSITPRKYYQTKLHVAIQEGICDFIQMQTLSLIHLKPKIIGHKSVRANDG